MYTLIEKARNYYLSDEREEKVEIEYYDFTDTKRWVFKGVTKAGKITEVFVLTSNKNLPNNWLLETEEERKEIDNKEILQNEIFALLDDRKKKLKLINEEQRKDNKGR